jgi:hypothetical protein
VLPTIHYDWPGRENPTPQPVQQYLDERTPPQDREPRLVGEAEAREPRQGTHVLSAKPTSGGPGGRPPGRNSEAAPVLSLQHMSRRRLAVGEEGFEPSHPFGHTDLNRARLPFRHSPE